MTQKNNFGVYYNYLISPKILTKEISDIKNNNLVVVEDNSVLINNAVIGSNQENAKEGSIKVYNGSFYFYSNGVWKNIGENTTPLSTFQQVYNNSISASIVLQPNKPIIWTPYLIQESDPIFRTFETQGFFISGTGYPGVKDYLNKVLYTDETGIIRSQNIGTAFNKDFGENAGNVARGTHTHSNISHHTLQDLQGGILGYRYHSDQPINKEDRVQFSEIKIRGGNTDYSLWLSNNFTLSSIPNSDSIFFKIINEAINYFSFNKETNATVLKIHKNTDFTGPYILEVDSTKTIVPVGKRSAYNLDFGIVEGTIAQGNHIHNEIVSDKSLKNNMYNIPFYNNKLRYEVKYGSALGLLPADQNFGLLTLGAGTTLSEGGYKAQIAQSASKLYVRFAGSELNWQNNWKEIAFLTEINHTHTNLNYLNSINQNLNTSDMVLFKRLTLEDSQSIHVKHGMINFYDSVVSVPPILSIYSGLGNRDQEGSWSCIKMNVDEALVVRTGSLPYDNTYILGKNGFILNNATPDCIVETNANKRLTYVSKKNAYNKDFGILYDNVARGDHTHSQYMIPDGIYGTLYMGNGNNSKVNLLPGANNSVLTIENGHPAWKIITNSETFDSLFAKTQQMTLTALNQNFFIHNQVTDNYIGFQGENEQAPLQGGNLVKLTFKNSRNPNYFNIKCSNDPKHGEVMSLYSTRHADSFQTKINAFCIRPPVRDINYVVDSQILEYGIFADERFGTPCFRGKDRGLHRFASTWIGYIDLLETYSWLGGGPDNNFDGIVVTTDHDENPDPYSIQIDCTSFPKIWASKSQRDANYQHLIIGYPESGKGIITEYIKLNNFNTNSVLTTNSNSEVVTTSNINIDAINEYTSGVGVTIEGVHFSDGDLYISGDNMIVMNYIDYQTQQNLMKLGEFDIYRPANTSNLNFRFTNTFGNSHFQWIKENGDKILGISMTEDLEINSVLATNADKNIISYAKNTAFNKNFGTSSNTVAEGNHEHISLLCEDSRNVYDLPGDYSNHLYFEMKDQGILNGGQPSLIWAGVLTFSHWVDDTGGPRLQFSYTDNGVTLRTGTIADGWNPWKTIAYSDHTHTLASLSEKSYNSLTDKPDLNPFYSLMHTGIVNFNGLSINTDNTKFDVGSGEAYYVSRLNPLNPTIKKVVWNAYLAQTTPYLLTNTRTFIGLRVDVDTPYVVCSNVDFTTDQLLYIVKFGSISHFAKTVITATYNYPLKYNIDWNEAMFIHKIGTVNLNGNIFYANGTNLKLNKTAGVFQRVGANFDTDKQNCSIVNTSAFSQISFRRAYLTVDKTSIVLSAPTTDLDPANYDDNGVLTALTAQKPYSIQLVIMYPLNNTYTMFVLYSQTSYANLTDARNALDTLQFTINADLYGGNLRAILILERSVTDLQTAISNGTAYIIDGTSLGLSVGSGTSSSGGISGYHNTLPDLQGGSANSYYHSNQAINTTDIVTFKGMTLRDTQGNNIPLQLNLYDDWSGQNVSGNDVTTCKINLGTEGYPNAIQTNIPNGSYGNEQRLDFATSHSSNEPTQIVRMSVMPFTGRVGIGTKTPNTLLHVNGTATLNNINVPGLEQSQIVETDSNRNLISVSKNNAYNRNFGTTSNTIAEGNHEHNSIVCEDSRDVLNMPGYYVKHLYHQLKDIGVLNGGLPSLQWTNVLTLSHWDDDTAGPRLQFSYLGNQFCLRTGTIASGWNSWKYFSYTDHNHTLSSLSEKSYNSLTDKPDLSSIHSHSNKSNLDSINQNLSNISNVSFNSISLNTATIDTINEKTQGNGVRLYNSKFYNNLTYLTNTILNLDYTDWSTITNELIIGTNSLLRFAGTNDLSIRTNQINSAIKFLNNLNEVALSFNPSTNYKDKLLEVDSNANVIPIAKNTAYNKNFGNTSNTVAEGNHSHTSIVCEDSRNVYNLPGDYSERLYFQMKDQGVLNGGLPTYIFAGVLTFSHWYDDSAGPRLQFSYANNSVTMRTGTIADGWGTWKQISYTDHNHTLASLSEKSYNSLTDKPDLSSIHSHSNKSTLDLINQDLSTTTGTPYWNELSTTWLQTYNTASMKSINVDNSVYLDSTGIKPSNNNQDIHINSRGTGVIYNDNITIKNTAIHGTTDLNIASEHGDVNITSHLDSEVSKINIGGCILVKQDSYIGLRNLPVTLGTPLWLNVDGDICLGVSSERYKENINYLNEKNRILELNAKSFNIKGSKIRQLGFIAEEVEQIIPDIVVKNGNNQPESLDNMGFIALLVDELKNKDREIKELRNTVKYLYSRIQDIDEKMDIYFSRKKCKRKFTDIK